jgi:hypothetical protein
LDYNANPGLRRMSSTNPNSRDTGNYILFENVSPAADGSFVLSMTWVSTNVGNTHQPAINGIQLVKVGTVTARPTLSAARAGSTLTISWTAAAAGFTLESSSSVGTGASWTPVTGTANPIAGAGTATVNTSTGVRTFYRLRKAS